MIHRNGLILYGNNVSVATWQMKSPGKNTEHIILFKEGLGTINTQIDWQKNNPDFIISADYEQLKALRSMIDHIIVNYPEAPASPVLNQPSVAGKSFREWFADLDEPDNIKAIKNMLCAPQAAHIDDVVDSAAIAIKNGFDWSNTPEGNFYWAMLHSKLSHG